MKARPCKLGTIPACLIIDGRFTIKVGAKIRYRQNSHGSKWEYGVVDRINPDGYLFISKL